MKLRNKLFTAFAGFVFLSACHPKTGNNTSGTFELSGNLSGGGEGISIYLDRISHDGVDHLDSTRLGANGSFSFHTNGIYKGFYILRITQSDFATLILDSNEKVYVKGNSQFLGDTYNVNGSPDTKLFCEFNQVSKENTMQLDSLQKHYGALINASGGNKKRIDSLGNAAEAPYDSLMRPYERYITRFLKANMNSFASLAAIEQMDADTYLDYYISLDSSLSKQYPNSAYVKYFHEKVETLKRVAIGAMAPDFSLPDTSGKAISLSSFKGKTVLIDFWASGSASSASTIPELIKLYAKYKDKDFTILSVSLDKDKGAWLAGVHKFKLKWPQVVDLKETEAKIVQLYNFNNIPFTVLVSADGKIIDKNPNAEELDLEVSKLVISKKM